MSPKRAWWREKVIQQLVDPISVAETADLLERRAADIKSAFQPRNEWRDWLTSTIATFMLRINRSERIERKLRDLASYRAFDFWEDDQKLAVETIALQIGKEPARVVAELRETPSRLEWLIEADLHDDGVLGLARLRRYVRSLHRQLKWYVDQFHVEHPNRFEGKAEPPVVATEPAPVVELAPGNDDTKPFFGKTTHQNDETKSIERAEPTVPASTSFKIEPPVLVHDDSNERGRHHSRPLRAGELSREYPRRQKAARRRTNLAPIELT